MAENYVVTAACVVAKTRSETGEGYYYRDAVLPAGVPVAEKKRLVEAGLVKVVDVEVVEVVEVVEDVPADESGAALEASVKPARASTRR